MIVASLIQGGFVGYVGAAAGYLLLTVLVLCWWNSTLTRLMLAMASLATLLWAAATAYDLYLGLAFGWAGQILEIARSSIWAILLLSLLYWLSPVQRSAAAAAIIALGVAIAAGTVVFGSLPAGTDVALVRFFVLAGHLVLALLGLALVENLFRNSPPARQWRIKHLCLGMGALFTYDFVSYADALLFQRLSVDLFLARGAVYLLVMPLLAVYAARGRKEGPEIAVSRQTVLHSATLIGAGLYLIAMAAVGYYVREFGGSWSSLLEAVFLFAAALLFLVSISSRSFRTRLRVSIEKNFFKYKYDYRAEWLRFIRTISERERGDDLRGRVVQAVCDIMDSPEGAILLAREPGKYLLAASWNLSRWGLGESEAAIAADSPLALFLERTHWIVDAAELAVAPERYPGLVALPAWMRRADRLWLILPLIQHEQLFGIIIIGHPRVPRALAWEDFDLLKTVGRQAASYLAEEETSQALAEARQFEEFNKRFAFVAHDIKNLASQLSLVLSNAARHRDNEAFQYDANETLRQSVDKLNRMLRQLSAPPSRNAPAESVALAPLLRDIVARSGELCPAISLEVQTTKDSVTADEDRLRAVVEHLVQNARDAVGESGKVRVRLTDTDVMAVIEIEDDGPGMAAEFVRDKLFRPFATTKKSGYGIGVYESRHYANSLGGRLDVVSEPGKGTVMRVSLPIAGVH
jgi:putative PEP-CTERM system histidine kinase